MRNTVRLVLVGLALVMLAGCSKGKEGKGTEESNQPAKTMTDATYIEVQAQMTFLIKQFAPRLEGNSEAEKAAFAKAKKDLVAKFDLKESDVEKHLQTLEKSGDQSRMQKIVMGISSRITELELGN